MGYSSINLLIFLFDFFIFYFLCLCLNYFMLVGARG